MLHRKLAISTLLLLFATSIAFGSLITLSTDNVTPPSLQPAATGNVLYSSSSPSVVVSSSISPVTLSTGAPSPVALLPITTSSAAAESETQLVNKKAKKQKLYDEYTGKDFNKKNKDEVTYIVESGAIFNSSNGTANGDTLKSEPPKVQYSKRKAEEENKTLLQISNTSIIMTSVNDGNQKSKQQIFATGQISSTYSAAASSTPTTTATVATSKSDITNFESTEVHADTHPLALGLGLGFGFLSLFVSIALIIHQKRCSKKIGNSSSSIGVYFTDAEEDEKRDYYKEEDEKKSSYSPSLLSSRATSITLRPSFYIDISNSNDNNHVNTRWHVDSFLNVITSVVARLPSHHRSSSSQPPPQQQEQQNDAPNNRFTFTGIQFPPRVSSLHARYTRLP